MRRMVLAAFFVLTIAPAQDNAPTPPDIYASAVADYNAGRIPQAKTKLTQLFERHPDYFRAYDLLWSVLGRTESEEARKAAVRRILPVFENAPNENRDEDFYANFIRGCEITGDTPRAEALRKELISKFPKGQAAQRDMLAGARNQTDPVAAVALYDAYLRDFDADTSWTQLAARDKFVLMSAHAELFNPSELLDAMDDLDARTKRFVHEFGNPYRYVFEIGRIAKAIVETNPAGSLQYIHKALAYIQENWTTTKEFDDRERYRLWPVLLDAYINLKDWPAAARLGEAFVRDIDLGAVPRVFFKNEEEAAVRRQYAEALQHTDQRIAAAEQRRLADSLLQENGESGLQKRRERQARADLLATGKKVPAAGFTLKSLDGRPVSLKDYRGKTVVLAFWATWCGPCRPEMNELKSAFERYRSNPNVAIVTISVDSEKDKVPPFTKEQSYPFPVLLSDGTVEEPYETQTIPRLYVVDPQGNIRYQRTGHDEDGLFQKRLDWMIEAARTPL